MLVVLFITEGIDAIRATAAVVIALLAILGAWRGIYRPLRKHFQRVNAGMDTLLGYPPVLDPGSGRELQPATPPLATRVYDLEETNKKMADALQVIANNQRDMLELRAQYEAHQAEQEERRAIGEKVVADFTEWRTWVDQQIRGWIKEQDQLAQTVRKSLETDTPS